MNDPQVIFQCQNCGDKVLVPLSTADVKVPTLPGGEVMPPMTPFTITLNSRAALIHDCADGSAGIALVVGYQGVSLSQKPELPSVAPNPDGF